MTLSDRISLLAKAIGSDIKKLYDGTAVLKVKSVTFGTSGPAIAIKQITLTYSTGNGETLVAHGLANNSLIFRVDTIIERCDGSYYSLPYCSWDNKNIILPVSNDEVFKDKPATILITYKS